MQAQPYRILSCPLQLPPFPHSPYTSYSVMPSTSSAHCLCCIYRLAHALSALYRSGLVDQLKDVHALQAQLQSISPARACSQASLAGTASAQHILGSFSAHTAAKPPMAGASLAEKLPPGHPLLSMGTIAGAPSLHVKGIRGDQPQLQRHPQLSGGSSRSSRAELTVAELLQYPAAAGVLRRRTAPGVAPHGAALLNFQVLPMFRSHSLVAYPHGQVTSQSASRASNLCKLDAKFCKPQLTLTASNPHAGR